MQELLGLSDASGGPTTDAWTLEKEEEVPVTVQELHSMAQVGGHHDSQTLALGGCIHGLAVAGRRRRGRPTQELRALWGRMCGCLWPTEFLGGTGGFDRPNRGDAASSMSPEFHTLTPSQERSADLEDAM